MKKTYWHKHPRGFANECDAYTAVTKVQRASLAERGYEQLSREDMRRHLRWVNRENEAWGSGRAFPYQSINQLQEFELEGN